MDTPPDTQQRSIVPLSLATRTATGTFQWMLEKHEDAQTPIFNRNNLTLFICGEEAFARIAQDIKNAQHSIDIVCWGFDPAMELTRQAGPWPRGDTWGDLLRDAALGKNVHQKKVQVRLLVWYDMVGSAIVSNMPGYQRDADIELRMVTAHGMVKAFMPRRRPAPLVLDSLDPRDRREIFNSHWYKDAEAGAIQGLSLRTRGGVHEDVLASLHADALAAHAREKRGTFSGLEAFGLEHLSTHHQKTIVIDYEGSHPCAYVMGLNSVTDYWDTQEHAFNDPRRGQGFEGDGKDHAAGKNWGHSDQPTLKPFQDYACRIEGQAVAAVCKNFTEAWNKAKVNGAGGGSNVNRHVDLDNLPPNLTQNIKPPFQRARILRTLPAPDGGEHSVKRLYYQASSFARHYLYIENQYFQHSGWVDFLKATRQAYVQGCAEAEPPVPMAHVQTS
jgi:phosphatidylserine/phosphatidylglycerophosphate/cardiolipin synthase-like enzyme